LEVVVVEESPVIVFSVPVTVVVELSVSTIV